MCQKHVPKRSVVNLLNDITSTFNNKDARSVRATHFFSEYYSRLPITRTFKGNRKKFVLWGVRDIGSSKKIAGSKEKNSFYCTVNILITFNYRNVK